jgi:hypothetical protein
MLALCKDLGFTVAPVADTPNMVLTTLKL